MHRRQQRDAQRRGNPVTEQQPVAAEMTAPIAQEREIAPNPLGNGATAAESAAESAKTTEAGLREALASLRGLQ